MFKILGVVLMCVQLIIGSPETEELKRKCLDDEEFPEEVKMCTIKDGIATFEFIERTMTFRCISIKLQNSTLNTRNLTIKVTSKFDLTYVSN